MDSKKWFNIGNTSAIVTRYRLDSQFHCSYLESRKVPEKTAANTGGTGEYTGNKRGIYLPSISDSADVISGDVSSGDFRWRHFWSLPVTSLLHTAPPQMINGWCFYITDVELSETLGTISNFTMLLINKVNIVMKPKGIAMY